MNKWDGALRWGNSQRLEFIEWILFWTGKVNRKSLESKFRISTPQASADLRKYQDLAPDNIEYDLTERTYLPTRTFVPRLIQVSADRYLLQVRALLGGAIRLEDTWFEQLPPISIVPDPVRSVESATLRALLAAIRARQEVEISYRSLSNSRFRIIGPHALGFDGHRWHVRAWCKEHDDFRDFVLARISTVTALQNADYDVDDDLEWNTATKLRITAHPGLDELQRNAIEQDYGISGGMLTIETRLAMAFYFIRRYNLDIENLPPERQQIHLSNLKTIVSDIEKARRLSVERIKSRRALAQS